MKKIIKVIYLNLLIMQETDESMERTITDLLDKVQQLARELKDLKNSLVSQGISTERKDDPTFGLKLQYKGNTLLIAEKKLIAMALYKEGSGVPVEQIVHHLVNKKTGETLEKDRKCTFEVIQFTTGCGEVNLKEEFKGWCAEEMHDAKMKYHNKEAKRGRLEIFVSLVDNERKKNPVKYCKKCKENTVEWKHNGTKWYPNGFCSSCYRN